VVSGARLASPTFVRARASKSRRVLCVGRISFVQRLNALMERDGTGVQAPTQGSEPLEHWIEQG
jgi:hypothetical protein